MGKKIAISGGGIGGLSTAIALQRAGFDVTVFEAASELKPVGAGLVLAANAIKALKEIGIGEDVLKEGRLLRYLYLKDETGKTVSRTDSKAIGEKYGGEDNFTIHRADLHRVLLSKLKEGTVRLGKRCIDFEQSGNIVKLKFEDGTEEDADIFIAADGINSVVRKKLIPGSLPRYAGYTGWRGITTNIPTNFDADSAYEAWGPKGRFGIVPLSKHRIYWFGCVNAQFADSRLSEWTSKELVDHFKGYYWPIEELIKGTDEENILWNDIIDIKPIKQFAFGNVVLIGDAAHATTPNMGQGACQAIEDAVFLTALLMKYEDTGKAFTEFERIRIPRTTKIVDISWRLGRIGQIENSVMAAGRNFMVKHFTPLFMKKQLGFLYDIDLKV